jgi:putative spermidine/putrescine transport system permease protein
VEAADLATPTPKRSAGRRLADLFHGRPRLQVGTLLAGPVGWLVIGYLGSLAAMLIASFWTVGELTGVQQTFSTENFKIIVEDEVYRDVALRSIKIASLVTVTCAFLAFPIAFYMAKIASARAKGMLVVAVLLPLWASYLVKTYAWRTILSEEGALNWALDPLGLSGPGYGQASLWLVYTYLWLPFMIIPIYAGLERIPDSLLSASEDLGAGPLTTFRRVILPLVFPAVVAGSIFTFSLSLGDYIAPTLVGSADTQLIGNLIKDNIVNNLPLAAAYTLVPISIMVIYLLIARRLGAFEHI